jgi:hypothetical protein
LTLCVAEFELIAKEFWADRKFAPRFYN